MLPGARAAAAIEVLTDWRESRRPVKLCLSDWGRRSRFAGSKDRAAISGLVFDALRHKSVIAWAMGREDARALVIGTLGHVWDWSHDQITKEFAQSPHAPKPLTKDEATGLERDLNDAPNHVQANMPKWLWEKYCDQFGDTALPEAKAQAARAPVDLRINALKKEAQAGLKALEAAHAEMIDFLPFGARVSAPPAEQREFHVQSLEGYVKGWFEIQDAGSQLVTLATGITSGQVLDYCAGGGGKSLALAAQMGGKGQIFAYDADGRRLAPIHERLKRASVHNVQVRDPRSRDPFHDLDGMDAVLVDAPCTGTGTWRRIPDAKWRLRENQLETRMNEQDKVLASASRHVRPGGMLFYVTCSLLKDENENRVDAFLSAHQDFVREKVADHARAGALLPDVGLQLIENCSSELGDLRLSPVTARSDGFYLAALRRRIE